MGTVNLIYYDLSVLALFGAMIFNAIVSVSPLGSGMK